VDQFLEGVGTKSGPANGGVTSREEAGGPRRSVGDAGNGLGIRPRERKNSRRLGGKRAWGKELKRYGIVRTHRLTRAKSGAVKVGKCRILSAVVSAEKGKARREKDGLSRGKGSGGIGSTMGWTNSIKGRGTG